MRRLLIATALLAVSLAAQAVEPPVPAAPVAPADPAAVADAQRGIDTRVLNSEGFLSLHPDLRWRSAGVAAFERGRMTEAMHNFRDAARYADKPSQAMVAELLWSGNGVARDRPLAYAWMDLAAERGYPHFLALRETYWRQLDAAERTRAIEVGQAVYAEFGDAVAKPRIERKLRQGRRTTTGSRVGSVGRLEVLVPGPGGLPIRIAGDKYYDQRFWQPELYFDWQDTIWSAPPRGRVEVGPLQAIGGDNRPVDPQPDD